jgi:diguanylate cyclase (GGDEF)-like protein/PAS domain S-box-containing protein
MRLGGRRACGGASALAKAVKGFWVPPMKRLRAIMADRNELMEAALESFPEGLALLDGEGKMGFWNHAAETITGFPSIEVVTRPIPWALEPLLLEQVESEEARGGLRLERGGLIRAQHRSGSELVLMMRTVMLRDALGKRIGKAVVFRLAEGVDSLPHGESSEESNLETAQEEIEEEVRTAYAEFVESGTPLGLLWIAADQARELRRTHGANAYETMLERMERTLTNGLRPSEEIGRWGDDEFLVVSHEATSTALAAHAQALAGLARTLDFRWWGDRPSLTVSIGAAMARKSESLVELFDRLQKAMLESVHAGGNHITLARER